MGLRFMRQKQRQSISQRDQGERMHGQEEGESVYGLAHELDQEAAIGCRALLHPVAI